VTRECNRAVRVIPRVDAIANLDWIIESCRCPILLFGTRDLNVALDALDSRGVRFQVGIGIDFRPASRKQERQAAPCNDSN
jgi:hypothetical protein